MKRSPRIVRQITVACRRAAPVIACTLAFALGSAMPARAQTNQRPSPRLGYVYPAGGQQGTTFTVSVGGQNLNGASAAFFSTPGIEVKVTGYDRPLPQKELNELREKAQRLQEKKRAAAGNSSTPAFTAEDEKTAADIRELIATRGNRQATPAVAETVTLQLTVAPTAPPGEHEFRLHTTAGLSNPLVFCVSQLPENTAPVITATGARPPQRGGASKPRIRNRDEREITLPAVLNGQVLPGETDRFRFTARQGERLTFAVAARALVPYLADAVPGWFQATLAVYDAQGRELAYADDFRFNPDPVLVCEIPADGSYTLEIKDAIYRGREDFVYRITAGELPFVTSIFPLGGAIGERVSFDVKGWNLPLAKLEIDARTKSPGTYLLSVREHGVQSNTVRFALGQRAPSLESESAGSSGVAPLALPAVVDGRIEQAGDEDAFSFAGTRGAEIVAEVHARRFGSPLDSVLTLSDAEGRPVASNDDCEDKGAGLLTHHADSRIAFTLPADGTYTVRLADAQRRGGADYGYRLRVGPPEPDFELRVVPSTINLRAGATVPVTVYALRRDGFAGEIVLGLQDMPAGLALSGARIPAHQDVVRLTLTAASNARQHTPTLLLAGTASIGGRQVTRRAIPADDMMQAFAYRHLVAAKELRLCIAGRGSTPRLASRIGARLHLDPVTRIRIATPAMKNVRNVTFELLEPPPGIAVQSVSHRGDSTEVVLSCDRSKLKSGEQGNLILEAYGERENNSSNATQRVQRAPLGTVPAIPFEVAAFDSVSS